jgi:hypothetical protein
MTPRTHAQWIDQFVNPLPALVSHAGDRAGVRFLEFFASAIRRRMALCTT